MAAQSTAIFRSDDTAAFAAARAIREDVFCREQGVSADLEWDGKDDSCTHFLLYQGEQPIATARLRPYAPGIAKIERVAVLKVHRSTGAGVAIMRAILDHLAGQDGSREALLHSQCAVAEFYARLGFVREGEVFEEANIPHIAMRLMLRQNR